MTQVQTRPLGITETVLRDSHQSLLATRMKIEDMIPAMERLDEIGYWSLEVWGGATFDSCMRFLNEDPWERLRTMRRRMPKTKLQMLLRGQNTVGYRHYADDVVERFVGKSVENGMDVFRIFDALNDIRNMEPAIRAVKKSGGHVQATVCYTISPVHSNDGFVKMAKELLQIGADSICIKDMAGLISPCDAFELVSRLKATTDVPISMHCHYTSGMASMAYFKAAEAGIDMVDCAISSMSLGTSQPPTETMVAALACTDRATGLDLAKLSAIGKYFAKVRKNYAHLEMNSHGVDTDVLQFQIPGGMISNLVNQLRDQGAEDKLPDVLAEVPRVRADLGYPPLVTPSSQIVGTQAVLNVLMGERYKMVPTEVKNVVKGMYGRTPAPIDPDVKKLILGEEQAIDCRPADMLEPEFEKAKAEIGDLAKSDEDVISYVLFPQVAKEFLAKRGKKDEGLTVDQLAAIAAVTHGIYNGAVAAQPVAVAVAVPAPVAAPAAVAAPAPVAAAVPAGAGETVTAPLPGKVLSVAVKAGDAVNKGDELCVIEAMKMGNSIRAQRAGTVVDVQVSAGDAVAFGATLVVLA
jgi:oxaloacetate decarboxylase alpha subunit